jgi:hypothetical protein
MIIKGQDLSWPFIDSVENQNPVKRENPILAS